MFLSVKRILPIMACLLFIFANFTFASSKDDAIKIVNSAGSFYAKNGAQLTLAEINKPKGKFVKGELYVFSYDLNGTNTAHPFNVKLIGKNFLDKPDAGGKFYRREILEGAKKNGSGWVDYLYKDPVSGSIDKKLTYYKLFGDIILCAGIYGEDKK